MNNMRVQNAAVRSFVAFLFVAVLTISSANAAVIVGIYLNPPSTAGVGASSTRSGANTFQIYAADDNAGTFGIATYSLTLGPAVTASSNRSPVTTIQDNNGDAQSAGFNLLRSSSNVNPMTGAENLPGQTPFLIKGFGQTAGSFAAVAAAAPQPASVVGPTTSSSWGGPYVGGTLGDWNGANGVKKWLFLGEGTYNPALLGANLTTALVGIVPSATFTVYGSPNDISQVATTTQLAFDFPPPQPPEPATITIAALSLFGLLGLARYRRSFPNFM
jgi:hypothetical protein